MMITAYVAGAGTERCRAAEVIRMLREQCGVDVLVDWTEGHDDDLCHLQEIEPGDMGALEQAKRVAARIAVDNTDAVMDADVVVLVWPGNITKGFYVEIGILIVRCLRDPLKGIFVLFPDFYQEFDAMQAMLTCPFMFHPYLIREVTICLGMQQLCDKIGGVEAISA